MTHAELKSGDLLYWRGTGIKAWLVRHWTHSEYSHVGMYWQNGTNPYVIEADFHLGVIFRPYWSDPPQAGQHTHLAFDVGAINEMRKVQGAPYSLRTAIATVFCVAGKGSQAFMCSELVVRLMEKCGWDWQGYQPTPEGVRLGVLNATGNNAEVLT